MIDGFKWSDHAYMRWQIRFKGIDKHSELKTASKVGRKSKKLIKSLCPIAAKKYPPDDYNGRYYLLGRSQIVFVIAGDDQTVVTVFHLYGERS